VDKEKTSHGIKICISSKLNYAYWQNL